jgi:hexosaminidase
MMRCLLTTLCLAISLLDSAAQSLLPQPTTVARDVGTFILSKKMRISADTTFHTEAQFLSDQWWEGLGMRIPLSPRFQNDDPILIRRAKSQPREGYRLTIEASRIVIEAADAQGAFYACITLLQWQNGGDTLSLHIPAVDITDAPVYHHRGLLLDCARHFMPVEKVKQYIRLLAGHKMNILHWHLTDDQGWRMEVDAFPELTRTGAWRTEKDGSSYGGYYTKEEIRQIVAYARYWHVNILPEIEMPGHAVAAIASYPWLSCTGDTIPVQNDWGVFKDVYCAGSERTFDFIETVLLEAMELFPYSMIHVGGDEAPVYRWEQCGKCAERMKQEQLTDAHALQTWFINRVARFLETHGRTLVGWDEIHNDQLTASAVVQSWRGMKGAADAARAGRYALFSPTSHCYLDYPLSSIDCKTIASFDPVSYLHSPVDARYLLGGEVNMWSEHVTPETVDAMVFPRLSTFSEVVWKGKVDDYEDHWMRLQNQLHRINIRHGWPHIPVALSFEKPTEEGIRITVSPSLTDTHIFLHRSGKKEIVSAPLLVSGRDTVVVEAVHLKSELNYTTNQLVWYHPGCTARLELGYSPSPYYTGGGDLALQDGLLGSDHFRDGRWQAIQGKDMIATITFAAPIDIETIRTGWYHYQQAWIFRPDSVVYETTTDGQHWIFCAAQSAEIHEMYPTSGAQEWITPLLAKGVLGVRMRAVNAGKCPPQHDAAGEASWLFCDEVVIIPAKH